MKHLGKKLREYLIKSGMLFKGDAHIVSLIISSNEDVLVKKQHLREAGFLVSAVRHPTVPRGDECLRITLTSNHTVEDIEAFCRALES